MATVIKRRKDGPRGDHLTERGKVRGANPGIEVLEDILKEEGQQLPCGLQALVAVVVAIIDSNLRPIINKQVFWKERKRKKGKEKNEEVCEKRSESKKQTPRDGSIFLFFFFFPPAHLVLHGENDAADHDGHVDALGAEVELVDGHVGKNAAQQQLPRLVLGIAAEARPLVSAHARADIPADKDIKEKQERARRKKRKRKDKESFLIKRKCFLSQQRWRQK